MNINYCMYIDYCQFIINYVNYLGSRFLLLPLIHNNGHINHQYPKSSIAQVFITINHPSDHTIVHSIKMLNTDH